MTEVRTKLKGLHTELEKTHRGEDKVCPAHMFPVHPANGRTENILFKLVSDARHGGAQHFEGGARVALQLPTDVMSEPSEMEKEDEPEIQEVDETEEVAVDEGTAPKTPSRRVHGIWEHFEDSPKDKKRQLQTLKHCIKP